MVHLMESIDVSKSNGPDKISGRMLKATALSNNNFSVYTLLLDEISIYTLHYIFNMQ